MTCEHTNKINEKMSALFGKLGDNNSDLYKEFGPFFKKGDIEAKLKKVEGGFFSNDYEAETFFKKETYINSIVVKKLWEELNEIAKLMNSCQCWEEKQNNDNDWQKSYMTSETKNRIEVGTIKAEKTILEYRVANYESKLKDSLNQLIVRERKAEELTKSCNDLGKLNAKNEARLERLNETEKQLKETEELYIGLVSSNASNNTRAIDMENQVEIKSQELERKEKKILELTVSDSTNKEKARKLEVAESQLRLSQELLSEKEAEIISLHKQLAQYKIKDHDKELDLAEEALGNIAQEFKIERKSKRKLCDAYSRLVCLKNINNNKIGINEAKTEVLEIEDELIELLKSKNSGTEEKVLEKKVRLFSKHCEEVEQKKFDLEQWKQRQQKFETRQEYRLSDWNSN